MTYAANTRNSVLLPRLFIIPQEKRDKSTKNLTSRETRTIQLVPRLVKILEMISPVWITLGWEEAIWLFVRDSAGFPNAGGNDSARCVATILYIFGNSMNLPRVFSVIVKTMFNLYQEDFWRWSSGIERIYGQYKVNIKGRYRREPRSTNAFKRLILLGRLQNL